MLEVLGARRKAVIGLAEFLGRAMAIAFIVMLTAAAVMLAAGMEKEANKAAEVGYYFLVVAVASMLASIALEGSKE